MALIEYATEGAKRVSPRGRCHRRRCNKECTGKGIVHAPARTLIEGASEGAEEVRQGGRSEGCVKRHQECCSCIVNKKGFQTKKKRFVKRPPYQLPLSVHWDINGHMYTSKVGPESPHR